MTDIEINEQNAGVLLNVLKNALTDGNEVNLFYNEAVMLGNVLSNLALFYIKATYLSLDVPDIAEVVGEDQYASLVKMAEDLEAWLKDKNANKENQFKLSIYDVVVIDSFVVATTPYAKLAMFGLL